MQAKQRATARRDPIKTLLQERLVVYTEIYEVAKKLFNAGEIDALKLFEAHASQLRADLDLRETKAERIEVLKQLVEVAKQSLEITEKLAQAGFVSRTEVLKAKARLLEAKIELERAKIAP